MESRSAGCATATGAAVRMQPDKASAVATTTIGSRNARATRTGAIPQSETALVLHRLWLTNRFLEKSVPLPGSRGRGKGRDQALTPALIGHDTPVPPRPQ